MRSAALVVHQTRDRIRLRLPDRRRDVAFFLDLYEDLREIPGVTDVVINPLTASVLLNFSVESARTVVVSLKHIGLLPREKKEEHPSTRPVLGRFESFFAHHRSAATDVRTVLLTLMIGIAIHQASKGKLLAPALSVLWYAYDMIGAHRREKQILGSPPATAAPQPDG